MAENPEASSFYSPFQKELRSLEKDEEVQKELTLGKRVGLYRILGDIGTGNFSKVKLARHILLKEHVAIKIVDKLAVDKKTQQLLFREMLNMAQLHHPNIIRLFEVVEDGGKMHLVLEYAPGGELFHKITSQGKLPETAARSIFSQIIAAVHHIHSKKIVHRDIKAENVFFATPEFVKLGDFGFSTICESNQSLTTFCGSPPYAAPELFTEPGYTGYPVDIWALGVLLYFISTGIMPFSGDTLSKLKNNVVSCNYQLLGFMSSPLQHLLQSILVTQPNKRPSLKKVMLSDWLSDSEFSIEYPLNNQALPKLSKNGSTQSLQGDQQQVIDYMMSLGVDTDTWKDHEKRSNSQSSVLGMYRILMHRQQTDSENLSPLASGRDLIRSEESQQGPKAHKRKSAPSKSKTCSIL